MNESIKERLVAFFPYAIAIVLPLAGIFLALWRFIENDREMGIYLLLVSLVSGLIWLIALGAV
ncbi:MAG: hypothetical protein JHC95_00900 [Solirubrobacteraceae bacterium]|nr:hypothetical protein [Solirubrobacteraceae bacterium]